MKFYQLYLLDDLLPYMLVIIRTAKQLICNSSKLSNNLIKYFIKYRQRENYPKKGLCISWQKKKSIVNWTWQFPSPSICSSANPYVTNLWKTNSLSPSKHKPHNMHIYGMEYTNPDDEPLMSNRQWSFPLAFLLARFTLYYHIA